MINNPPRNIHTDYATDDVLKSSDVNAVVTAVAFDFVITKERVDEYRTAHSLTQASWLDVGELLWEGDNAPDYTCGGRSDVHILINFHTTVADRFNFGGRLTNLVGIKVHVHSMSSYRANGTTLEIYYHTHGSENYVLFDEDGGSLYRGASLHVGSFTLQYNDGYPEWHATAPFVYEHSVDGIIPTGGSGGTEPGVVIRQEAWLSNNISDSVQNIVDIGWIYEDTYDDINNVWTVDSRNPLADEFIDKLDAILSKGAMPYIMYSCLSRTNGSLVPYDPSIDPRTDHPTRLSALFDIQSCAYYFMNPLDNGYTVRLKINNRISLRKSSITSQHYDPVIVL